MLTLLDYMSMIYVPVPRKEVYHFRRNRDTVVSRAPYHLCADRGRDYLRIIHDPKAFLRTLDDCLRQTPELFPVNFASDTN